MTSAIVSCAVGKLMELLKEQYALLSGVGEQVRAVEIELTQIQRYLRDADGKTRANDARARGWASDIRRVSFEIEDAIDTFLIEVSRSRHEEKGIFNCFVRLVLKPVELPALHKLGEKLTRIDSDLKKFFANKDKYDIQIIGDDELLSITRPPIADVPDSKLVGLEGEERKIVDQLVRGNDDRMVVSIVGCGGVGKSTLARKAFRNPKVRKHFDCYAWLDISWEHERAKLLKLLLKKLRNGEDTGLGKELEEQNDVECLIVQIKNYLKTKRYLVMDDMWRKEAWICLKDALPDYKNRSRVLMTTRFRNVARNAHPGRNPYMIPLLNQEESLKLLLSVAFPKFGNNDDPLASCEESLKGPAELIAKKCHGLPLALVVLGRKLSEDKQHSFWNKTANTMSWRSEGKDCMQVLATSYEDLPFHLKPCFLYLAVFPENHTIPAWPLIKMWIAEGFVKPDDNKTPERTAELWLEELIQKCLVETIERSSSGTIKKCRIHPMLREFAISECKEIDFLMLRRKEETGKGMSEARRFVVHCEVQDLKDSQTMPNLRSFLSFNVLNPGKIEFKLLRVMELCGAQHVQNLPKGMKYMVHLRYLGLRSSGVHSLPSSIDCLRKLETLDTRDTKITCLPKSLWKIETLRHVHVSREKTIAGPPASANLINLQTLKVVDIPKDWKKEPPHLTSLEKLGLRVSSSADWESFNTFLGKLKCLVSVNIIGNSIPLDVVNGTSCPSYPCIQSLWLDGKWSIVDQIIEFPPNLTKLTLTKSGLEIDPMPMLEKLQGLKFLVLGSGAYTGKEMECLDEKGFPKLKALEIKGLEQLEVWNVRRGALSKLERLCVESCLDLKALPDLQHVTSLKNLQLLGMPEFELRVREGGADWHKIEHARFVKNPQRVVELSE